MKRKFGEGSKFIVYQNNDEEIVFMLVECHEEGFSFQLVCVEGYHSGQIFGLIESQSKSEKFIDLKHLKKQLKRNLLNYNDKKEIQFLIERN